jgi:hypothetical protein
LPLHSSYLPLGVPNGLVNHHAQGRLLHIITTVSNHHGCQRQGGEWSAGGSKEKRKKGQHNAENATGASQMVFETHTTIEGVIKMVILADFKIILLRRSSNL